ncbi:NifU family protein [Candidatus Bathyarchaeota archaeon]|nr:NifU family protein [Candidatus Bathyarchaeota archaeon]MBS7630421.1 NifU family protein [Candidatus Bathyarchaeota archaeon]
MDQKIEVSKAIEEIRPHLQADGGDVQLVDVIDGVVKIKLKGTCAGCPMSQMTVKWGVENYLKKKVPGVKSVEAV